MLQRYYATVACPACGTRFQTPIEQILDVRVNPEAKNRLLSGAINVAVCPSCGTGGALNLPFIYHDPEKEIALLYLPVGAGDTEVQRQQAAGRLTRQLMDAMPQEERKGYLFQPEVFLTMENIVKRVLELEGVTEEDIAYSQKQRAFLDTFMSALEEDWPQLIAENEALLNEDFFRLVQYMMQVVAMAGAQEGDFNTVQKAYTYLVENTAMGKLLSQRNEVLQAFTANPDQNSLLEALIAAPDEETVAVLVQSGIALMDYTFFQMLAQRIESAEDPGEKARLTELRRTILKIRDVMTEASEDVARARAELLEKLLNTEDPLKMARSYLSELDDMLVMVLRSEMTAARNRGDKQRTEALQRVATVVNQVTEENMPPEIVLVRRLLMSPTDEQMQEMLQKNQKLLQPEFFQFLEGLEAAAREQNEAQTANQLTKIHALALQYAPQPETPVAGARPQQPSTPPSTPPAAENRTASGLIIAKH
ncbi:MAG TPA: CpXC domain-containing protein [Anaerolineae bacterium]|nr:CpXC domain-containing protein [Anaerolineae bacterium]HQH38313.1 CpXC domain-containing protein [Anaerolineae bacterium]